MFFLFFISFVFHCRVSQKEGCYHTYVTSVDRDWKIVTLCPSVSVYGDIAVQCHKNVNQICSSEQI